MADTDVDLAAFTTALGLCKEAVLNGAWSTARVQYAAAEIANAALLVRSEHADTRMQRRDSLAGVWKAIALVSAASTGGADRRRLIGTRVGFGGRI